MKILVKHKEIEPFKGNTEQRDKKNVAISEGYGSILVYGSMCCALTETQNKICFGHIFNLVLFNQLMNQLVQYLQSDSRI